MKNKISLFLDSGAFSAWTKQVSINIDEYIEFIKEHIEYIDVYANLDVIGDAKKTYENQKYMESKGLMPLPVFHAIFEPFSCLERYIDEGHSYIAFGGMAGGTISVKQIMPILDIAFKNYVCDESGMPKIKIHGFGLTSHRLMLRYPWYSVDSTSWVMTSRMGSIYIPRYKNEKWTYDEDSWKITISSRSPTKTEFGRHFDTLSENVKEQISEYLSEKGYKLGKSEFKIVSGKKYKLEENEKWFGKELPDGAREVEMVIEDGLCNNYKLRDEVNIIYFLDLEKSMPEWPWPFKAKGVQGFSL